MILSYDKIRLFDNVLFGRVIAKPPTKTCASTTPKEAYLLHVREGECWAYSENEKQFLVKGESVLLHGMYVGHLLPDNNAGMFEAVSVRFNPEVLKRIHNNDLLAITPSAHDLAEYKMAKLDVSVLIDKYFDVVVHFFENRLLINNEILALKLKEMLLLLLQTKNADRIRQILQNLINNKAQSFKQIVEAHIFSDLTLEELAHLANLSLSSFKRRFKIEYGTTPYSYIQTKRLEKAKRLLEVSDLSISEIAFDCGFKTTSHFSKKFKEHFDIPPSVFKMTLSGQ